MKEDNLESLVYCPSEDGMFNYEDVHEAIVEHIEIIHQHPIHKENPCLTKLLRTSTGPSDNTLYERTSKTFKAVSEASRRLGIACTEYLNKTDVNTAQKQTKTEE